jgi:hypothetical protein
MQRNKNKNDNTIGRIGDFYINPHNVQLIWLSDELITVVGPYSKKIKDPDIEIEYSFIGMVHTDFANIFAIDVTNMKKAQQQMDAITSEQMEALYRRGMADLSCSILIKKNFYSLYFQLQNGNMKAYDDTNDILLRVPTVLEAPEDLVKFTKDHFQHSPLPGIL